MKKQMISIVCAGLCAVLLCGSTPLGFITGEETPETEEAAEVETTAEPETMNSPETEPETDLFYVETLSGKKILDG